MKKPICKSSGAGGGGSLTAGAPVSVMAAEEQSETVAVQGCVSTGTAPGYRSDDVTWNAAAQRR